jgi:hypothetical protein
MSRRKRLARQVLLFSIAEEFSRVRSAFRTLSGIHRSASIPVARQGNKDFMGLAGYFLIGSINNPSFSVRYEPATYANTRATTLTTSTAAYDNDITTAAAVIGDWWTTTIGYQNYESSETVLAFKRSLYDCIHQSFDF